jgi:hypothetical protein
MIKAVIDKLEDVAEAFRAEYTQGADGKFYVDLGDRLPDNHPAVGALVRAKQHEAEERARVAASLASTKAELEKAKNDLHDRLKGKVLQSDLEALEVSYKTKIADVEARGKEVETRLQTSLRGVLVESEAQRLASKLALDADAAELLAESIQRRLAVEIGNDGKAIARVLDSAGKPSAATIEDLEKEIIGTKKYAGLLLGSRASGSSAAGSKGGGSASPGKVDWLRGSPADLAAAAAKVNPLLGG